MDDAFRGARFRYPLQPFPYSLIAIHGSRKPGGDDTFDGSGESFVLTKRMLHLVVLRLSVPVEALQHEVEIEERGDVPALAHVIKALSKKRKGGCHRLTPSCFG